MVWPQQWVNWLSSLLPVPLILSLFRDLFMSMPPPLYWQNSYRLFTVLGAFKVSHTSLKPQIFTNPHKSDTKATTLGCDVILYAVRKQRGYKSVLLYVHQKRDAFSPSLYLCSHQGSAPSLPNSFTCPLCFLSAYKMMSSPSVLAGALD